MSRLVWKPWNLYKSGIEQAVLYLPDAVVWNGLIALTEQPSDSDVVVAYYDGQKYTQKRTSEGFNASVEAFTYPNELIIQEDPMGMSYRVELNEGYELHLLYNVTINTSDTQYVSQDDSISTALFKWDLTTQPVLFDGGRTSSHLIINSHEAYPDVLTWLEWQLYGTDTIEPHLPSPDEILAAFHLNSAFTITDNGDGTWTASGPAEYIQMLDATTYKITTPSIDFVDASTYKIRSW